MTSIQPEEGRTQEHAMTNEPRSYDELMARFEREGFSLATFDEYRIPEYMRDTIVAYILTGRPCGHFLEAVLSNDLLEAVGRADSTNVRLLPEYVQWLYTFAPSDCWKSPARVDEWMRKGGLLEVRREPVQP